MSDEHEYELWAAKIGTETTLWVTCSCGWEHELGVSTTMEGLNKVCAEHNPWTFPWARTPIDECPNRPHRGPEGPNEDISQCGFCGLPSYAMRPWGETFGEHLDDCSLPVWHESYCQPGGSGHPPAKVIRG
jgi:hypothetical protein